MVKYGTSLILKNKQTGQIVEARIGDNYPPDQWEICEDKMEKLASDLLHGEAGGYHGA